MNAISLNEWITQTDTHRQTKNIAAYNTFNLLLQGPLCLPGRHWWRWSGEWYRAALGFAEQDRHLEPGCDGGIGCVFARCLFLVFGCR